VFPTQGDVGVLPYTVILWDAADRGFFFADWAGAVAGVVLTDLVLTAIGTSVPPHALLVSPAGNGERAAGEQVWMLSLETGSLGSDPGAVTYQGEPMTGEEAEGWVGIAPADLPEGPQDLGSGFLILAGLSGLDLCEGDGVRLPLR
jgi:hypothetical protein